VKLGLPIALSLIALGGMIEVAQSFVPGRFASMGDFVANAVGVALGLALSRLFRASLATWQRLPSTG
jgi:VanZ family protein